MTRRILFTIIGVCLAASTIKAESPLSSLGYGLFQESAGSRAAGMGLASLAVYDSLGLNLQAPSHWSGGSQARFGFQSAYVSSYAEDATGSVDSDGAGLTGFAMAFPLGHERFAGFTLTPLTRMDYRFKGASSDGWTTVENFDRGSGGITQSLIAFSTPITEDMRLGVGFRGLFGTISRTWETTFPSIRSDSVRAVVLEDETRVIGMGWNLSWQWISKPLGWSAGAVVSGPVETSVQREKIVTAGGFIQEESAVDQDESIQVPWSVALGAGKLLGRHLALLEVSLNKWGSVDEPSGLTARFLDAYRLSTGWEWSPEYRPLDPFWRSLTYRGGLYLQDSYIRSATGHQPRKLAFTTGLSLPYSNGRSRLDIALELGWMGDRDLDLVGERTIGITFGINHKEQWFVGRRNRY